MIRFIIKRRICDKWNNGLTTEGFETVDIDVPLLEQVLCGGGMGEGHYDIRDLVGVEIIPEETKP